MSAAQPPLAPRSVVIAVDPHKASRTAVAVTAGLAPADGSGSRSTALAIASCDDSPSAGPTPVGRSRAQPGSERR